jgi:CelD/BcsL family acetyltransferase involved in cellulose biosynthesis
VTEPAVEIIRDRERLNALTPEWWSLWRRAPNSTVFQSPAWILPWWDTFRPGELCTMAVHLRGELAGLVPTWLERGRLGSRLLPLGIGLSDYCDVLLDPNCASAVGNHLATALADLEWESCEFAELTQNACALDLPLPPGTSSEVRDASIAPLLAIPAAVHDLSGVVPAVQNRNVRRARAAAAKRGPVAITAADAANLQDCLAELIRLHNARWTSRGEQGVFADPRVARFHLLALPGLYLHGVLRMYRMSIGGEVVAAYYGYLDHNRAYAYLQGYDPEYANESPGAVVLAYAIEEAIREGAREFHFLRGDEAYKFAWGAARRSNRTRVFSRINPFA